MQPSPLGMSGTEPSPRHGRLGGCMLLLGCLLAITLAGCSRDSSTQRYATDEINLSLIALRHNDQLLVQVTLSPESDPDARVQLGRNDRLLASLNGKHHALEEQWNGVYSAQIPYTEGILLVNFERTGNFDSAPKTRLHLPVSPEFQSPPRHALFHTQNDAIIPLVWTGIATENGHYELRCNNRNEGSVQFHGTFSTNERQRVNIAVDELLHDLIDNNRRGFCEAAFNLRGISTNGSVSPELAGGDVLFESNVTRNVIIRHNALF